MGRDAKILTGIGILTIIIVVVAAFTIGSQPPQEETKILGESEKKSLVRNESHQIKAKDAKVTVVEFGDFQCPACGMAHPIAKQIKDEYKGKINFTFRHFPLVAAHKNAMTAALAAEAAGAQNKFWEMHDKLFENQQEWSESNNALDIFATYAKDLRLDVDKFKKDVQDKKYEKNVQNDLTDGYTVGVNSTPTFYINGKQFTGVLTHDQFKAEIDSQLK